MKSILNIAAALLLAPMVFAGGPAVGWWSNLYEEETVPLSKILQNPTAFRDMDVSFVVQFHKVGAIENPFYTKFEKDRYVNFSVWPDESPLWVKEEYKKDFAYMFIDRLAKESTQLANAKTYDRFVITGRVESIFKGQPWIEVRGFKALPQKMTEPALAHLVKAHNFKRLRRFDAAAAEFHLANETKDLPDNVKFTSLKEEGVCLAAADRPSEALVPLEVAMTIYPKDVEVAKLSEECKARSQETPAPAPKPVEEKKETPAGQGDGEKKPAEGGASGEKSGAEKGI